MEIRFLGKFGPNIKNCHFKLKLVLDLDEYAEIYGGVYFFSLRPEILLLGNFGPKTQNRQFKVKLGTKTNSQYVHFFCFQSKITFLGNID